MDKVLVCDRCKREFVFSAAEQDFFQQKGFQNIPKRCRTCRLAAKGLHRKVQETDIACANCKRMTTVPFKPIQGRPVLCRACFDLQAKQIKEAVGKSPTNHQEDGLEGNSSRPC